MADDPELTARRAEGRQLTHAELEERAGQKIGPKVEFQLIGDELWHRDGAEWFMYPRYPEVFRPGEK